MKNKFKVQLVQAHHEDYPIIKSMVKFYIYDLSRSCKIISKTWKAGSTNSHKSLKLKKYFIDPTRKAFLIKVNDEIAGFILLNQAISRPETKWNIGEFYILAKFQNQGIGKLVAHKLWNKFPSTWEVSVDPENLSAIAFWQKCIKSFMGEKYLEEVKIVDHIDYQPEKIIFSFDIANKNKNLDIYQKVSIYKATVKDISEMIALSYTKRRAYEKAQPQFWRYAVGAEEVQSKWFKKLLISDDHIMLIARNTTKVLGFIIGKLIEAPEVYDPLGPTIMIDDFCVDHPSNWSSIGSQLLSELKRLASQNGATQIVVVAGNHDEPKRQFLKSMSLQCTSEWYMGRV